jgi:hypothetical protein
MLHHATRVHDRNGRDVVLIEKVLQLAQVRFRRNGVRLFREVADPARRIRKHQVADADDALEPALLHDDIDIVNGEQRVLDVLARQVFDHLAHGQRHRVGRELGHHEPAGLVGFVGDQFANFFGVFLVEFGNDRFGIVDIEFREHVDAMIAGQFLDDGRGRLGRHLLDQVRGVRVGNDFQQVRRLLGRQQRQQPALIVRRKQVDVMQQFVRFHGVEPVLDILGATRTKQFLQGSRFCFFRCLHLRPSAPRLRDTIIRCRTM